PDPVIQPVSKKAHPIIPARTRNGDRRLPFAPGHLLPYHDCVSEIFIQLASTIKKPLKNRPDRKLKNRRRFAGPPIQIQPIGGPQGTERGYPPHFQSGCSP